MGQGPGDAGHSSRRGTRYFGPYAHAYAIRETLDHLLRTFPIRTCTDNKLDRHAKLGKPCLLYHIEKCSAPCVGEVGRRRLSTSHGGRPVPVPRWRHRARCWTSCETGDAPGGRRALEFEKAARVRDRLATVRKAIERQQMVAERNEDLDVVGIAQDDLEAAVFVFFVRRGRVTGQPVLHRRQGGGPRRRPT